MTRQRTKRLPVHLRSPVDAILNADNPLQGERPRVLFVCSAGMLRSATAAHVFSAPPFNWNTRAAGSEDYALVPVTTALIRWAQVVVFMKKENHDAVVAHRELAQELSDKKAHVHIVGIPDDYRYRHPELIAQLVQVVPSFIPRGFLRHYAETG